MHQSFTGNARKTRQVNLGGRSTTDPWAALSGSTKSSHGTSGTQSTVAIAHADRVRRQHERERITASRKIQRTWRGHASRRTEKTKWRLEWDEQEKQRLGITENICYEDIINSNQIIPAYQSSSLILSQFRLLVHFQEFRHGLVRSPMDTARVLYAADALARTSPSLLPNTSDRAWKQTLVKVGTTAVRHMKSIISTPHTSRTDAIVRRLSSLIQFVTALVPDDIARKAAIYFEVLQQVIASKYQVPVQDSAVDAILVLLSTATEQNPQPYLIFLTEILGSSPLSESSRVLDHFSTKLDQAALANAVMFDFEERQGKGIESQNDISTRLWQLSYIIYFHKQSHQLGSNMSIASTLDYINAFSLLLGRCANEIASVSENLGTTTVQATAESNHALASFVRENLTVIVQEENVRSVISQLSQTTQNGKPLESKFEFNAARMLANYAVAMLRAFPSKATNIRMWLYQGSVTLASGRDISIIQYFWSIASKTMVFKKIVQNHRNVLSVLTEAAPENTQIGRPSLRPEEVEQWRAEWRIILLFFELYSFVLKLMDDEDFFSLEKSEKYGFSTIISNQFRRSALPLSEIAIMTTFLKNLAFTLYWNAADLVDTNEFVENGGIAALFGTSTYQAKPKSSEIPKPQTLAGNGVSQSYLKDLSTGLLRMLHERDSRRNFLSPEHWLMTSQVNMAGFIPAVVAEEEKRHELADDDDDLEESEDSNNIMAEETEEHLDTSTMLRSMFGIREPHIPRSMTSRIVERQERQRNQAKRKRQLESLAPRLEILRNLPFFIPFETRVQIFREFVHRDQLRRRGGYVDPDNWRMNVASTTQGRGHDGRPLGLDIISRQHAEIHRESVFEDAYAHFYELGEGLKEPIQISFIDKFGSPEAGIDGGGVTKEFLMSVTSEALDPKRSLAMFQENDQRFLYPNPLIFEETAEHLRRAGMKQGTENFSWNMREFLRRFEFLGRVVGKCLYEGILVDVNFAGFFLLKWALTGGSTTASSETGYRASINDLRDFDEELYQGLLKLKNYPGDVESDFSLNFTVSDTLHISDESGREFTQTHTRDLLPNGSNMAVTNLNRLAYIDRIVRYRLQEQPRLVTNAFLKGLGQIVQPMWLAMFNQKELQKLVGGDNSELDIADLRRNTLYGGLYVVGDDGREHPTVELFWKVLKEMDDADRRKVVKFVTSTPRAPLLGFSHLNPKFSIRDSSEDQDRLPSTSTCVNLLKLPRYGDMKTMREKLLYAVNSGAGFDLS